MLVNSSYTWVRRGVERVHELDLRVDFSNYVADRLGGKMNSDLPRVCSVKYYRVLEIGRNLRFSVVSFEILDAKFVRAIPSVVVQTLPYAGPFSFFSEQKQVSVFQIPP